MGVTQTGPLFRLEWDLTTPEDVEITRTVDDVDTVLGVVDAGIETFVDTIDEIESGTEITWTFIGQTSSDEFQLTYEVEDASVPPLEDDRRYLASLLVASRLWKRKDAPFGIAGGGELGTMRIGRYDVDVSDLLTGLRRSDSDLTSQTWPTIDETKAYVGASTATDAEISPILDAAIGIVKRRCRGAGMA